MQVPAEFKKGGALASSLIGLKAAETVGGGSQRVMRFAFLLCCQSVALEAISPEGQHFLAEFAPTVEEPTDEDFTEARAFADATMAVARERMATEAPNSTVMHQFIVCGAIYRVMCDEECDRLLEEVEESVSVIRQQLLDPAHAPMNQGQEVCQERAGIHKYGGEMSSVMSSGVCGVDPRVRLQQMGYELSTMAPRLNDECYAAVVDCLRNASRQIEGSHKEGALDALHRALIIWENGKI